MSAQVPDRLVERKRFEIWVPPDPQLLRVVRLSATGLASLSGLGMDLVEALRVAVDELVGALIRSSDGSDVHVRVSIADRSVSIRSETVIGHSAFAPDPVASHILGSVTAQYEFSVDDDVLCAEARIGQPLVGGNTPGLQPRYPYRL